MNIPFYKNIWYWLVIVMITITIFIAYNSTKTFGFSIINPENNYTFVIEVFLRSLFNPLWAVTLFFYNKAEKLNSRNHYDILKFLQGVVSNAMDNGQKKILTSTLAEALIDHKNIESKIRKSLDSGINMQNGEGSPTL